MACNIEKGSEFWADKRRKTGLKSRCIDCSSAANRARYSTVKAVASTKAWREKNKDKHLGYCVKRREKIKDQLIAGYGGKCTCCGENEKAFLTLEHIGGGGRAHRAEKKNVSLSVYQDVIKRGFLPEYTILCMNCNFAKRYGKECPHMTKGTQQDIINDLVAALEAVKEHGLDDYNGTQDQFEKVWNMIDAALAKAKGAA